MSCHRTGDGMSARELDGLPEQDLDKLLAFLRPLKDSDGDAAMPT